MKFSDISFSDIKKNNQSHNIRKQDIAVIGMNAQLPYANNWRECWSVLENSIDCMRDFPEHRKQDSKIFMQYMNQNGREIEFCNGGYLDSIAKFDTAFFRIPPNEAKLMDPHQRMFLKNVWNTIEDAGYSGERIKGSLTGIYLGYSGWPIYGQIISSIQPELLPLSVAGNISSVIASRVSHMLDLRGPSMLIDTACSSSLVAIHLACQSLKNRECEMAIAGGVKLNFIQMISRRKDGISIDSSLNKTLAFDENSDGASWGEGVISFLLKPLDKAIKDEDHIHAVIKGSAINQDGQSIGITAPNVAAQEEVILKAWEDAEIDPSIISYIEAHGTGTSLGDPIEIEGITKAFNRYTNKKQFCAISSFKTNIGHLDCAAGAAGMLKAVLSLKNKKIPPLLHFSIPNKKIHFENSPVYINDRLLEWESPECLRTCGVSSFGLSGTNCHVVLQEYNEEETMENYDDEIYEIFTVSANSIVSLLNIITEYIVYIKKSLSLHYKDICYTANTGREKHKCRIACIVISRIDLLLKLEIMKKHLYNGFSVEITNELLLKNVIEENDITSKKLLEKLEICKRFNKKADIDFLQLYQYNTRTKVTLPTYAYEEKEYWLDIPNNFERRSREKPEKINSMEVNENRNSILINGLDREPNEKEKDMAEIWSEVLGLTTIDVNNSFYEIGGDSLSATLIIALIHKKFECNISLIQFLSQTTFLNLVQYIQKLKKTREYEIMKIDRKDYYSTSSAQKRVYIVSELEEDTVYNQPNAFIINGNIKEEIIQDIFLRLIKRHEALRTSFHMINGEIVQKIHDFVDFNLEYAESDEKDIPNIIKLFLKPFNLNCAPLFRAKLVKLASERHFFIYDIHHIIADGWSINLVVSEFYQLLSNQDLPKITVQYKDFATWQNNYLCSNKILNQEKYWCDEFSTPVPTLNLPTDNKRNKIQNHEVDNYKFTLQRNLALQIEMFSVKTNSTYFELFITVFSILIGRLGMVEDVVVGSPVISRTHADLRNIMGMFVNTLAVRLKPKHTMKCKDYLNYVKDKTKKALENQDYQFEQLVDKICKTRDVLRHPIFDTMLVYDNKLQNKFSTENSDINFSPYDIGRQKQQFDITFHIVPSDGSYNLEWIYSKGLFQSSTIKMMNDCYINLIVEFINKQESFLIDLEIENYKEYDKVKNKASLKADFDF